MKPFNQTIRILTGNHVSKGNTATHAVHWLVGVDLQLLVHLLVLCLLLLFLLLFLRVSNLSQHKG